MLGEVLDSLGMKREFWAEFLGVSRRQLEEWASGARPMPRSFSRKLSALIGISPDWIDAPAMGAARASRLVPPLWLKLREERLGENGFRAVAAARLLASHYEEALYLGGVLSDTYRGRFQEIRLRVDPQSPAEEQGLEAAEAFLEITQLGQGGLAIGEVFRGHLRAMGLLVLETPMGSSKLEGFCVPVSTRDGRAPSRPCLLANSYRTTWFRRNYVLLHELAHAVFDVESSAAVFDSTPDAEPEATASVQLAERRADSFARHGLVSRRLLTRLHSSGTRLAGADADGMARAIAQTHAEQKLVARMAREYGLVDEAEEVRLRTLDCANELKKVSFHALGLAAVPREQLIHHELDDWGDRHTSFPIAGLRLPVQLVRTTLDALARSRISPSKAAELLMVSPEELVTRFRATIPEVPEVPEVPEAADAPAVV